MGYGEKERSFLYNVAFTARKNSSDLDGYSGSKGTRLHQKWQSLNQYYWAVAAANELRGPPLGS